MFWTENITNILVDQRNLYSTQVTGASLVTNTHESKQFFGIHTLMDTIKLPKYRMYWVSETC